MDVGGTQDFVHLVWSPFLGQGSETGFAFIFRPGRLIGVAKPTNVTVVLSEDIRGASIDASVKGGFHLLHLDTENLPGKDSETMALDRFTIVSMDPKPMRRKFAFLGRRLKETYLTGPAKPPAPELEDPEKVRQVLAQKGVEIDHDLLVGMTPLVWRNPGEAQRAFAELGIDLEHGLLSGSEKVVFLKGIREGVGFPDVVRSLMALHPPGTIDDLEAAKVFEVSSDEVERIEVVAPTSSAPGRIAIHTARGVEAINVTQPPIPSEDPLPALLPRLEEFAPGRVLSQG